MPKKSVKPEIETKHKGNHNIKSAYKCDFCGNKVESDFVDVESTDRRV